MGLSVHFKTASGENNTRRFLRNEGVSIYGKSTTLTGIINPGTLIRIDITDKNGQTFFFSEKFTDLWGDYDFWFRTPMTNQNMNIRLIASYPVSGQDVTNIPIAVGDVTPASLPIPEKEWSWLEYLPLIAVGIGVLFLVNTLKD